MTNNLECFVVYQTATGKCGYRGIAKTYSDAQAERDGSLLAGGMVSSREAVQCWCLQAENGGKAITQVKHLMRTQALINRGIAPNAKEVRDGKLKRLHRKIS